MIAKTALMMVAVLTMAGVATGASAGTTYNATSDPDVLSEKVSLAGIDLQTKAGAEIALHRIRSAAHDVCGADPDIRDLGVSIRRASCLATAVDHAVAAVGSPILTAMNGGGRWAGAQLASGR